MEDNSTISNFSNNKRETKILEQLHQIIEVVDEEYPNQGFKEMGQKFLKFDDEELNYYEHFFKFSREMYVDFFEKKPNTGIEIEEFRIRWNNELDNRNKFCGLEIRSPVEGAISMLKNTENVYDLRDDTEEDDHFMSVGAKSINDFCDGNGFSDLLRRRLLNLLRFDPCLTALTLFEHSVRLIRQSDAISVLNRHKTIYDRLTGIIPCEEEFIQYLKFRHEVYLDAESMKVYLSEYMDNEVNKTYNLPKNRKYKNAEIIDITPQQTLSIDTTFANMEESKELSTDSNLQNIEKDYCEVFFFNDWLSYRVFYQVQFGVQMCNDTKNFTKLIGCRGMSIDTLNKIQKEQSIVYEIMVNQELELLKALFRVKYVFESVEPLEYLKMRIENVENDLKTTNKETYYEIISTRKERGIKYGARLISPDSYYHYNNINVGIIKFYPDSYEGLIRESDVVNSSVYGNEWTFIEAQYYFLKWLRRLSAGEFYFEISEENRIIEVTKNTSAHVDEGKEDKRCLFNSLQIAIAVTMVHEKTGQFPKKVSKTNSEIKRKFVEDIEKGFKFENVPERFFREYASLQLSKDYLQNLEEEDKKGVKRILELGGYTELLKDIK